MKRSVLCALGIMLLGAAVWIPNLMVHAAPRDEKVEEVVGHQLFRRDYPTTPYASYLLEVHCGPEQTVRAYLDLRKDSKKLASIPLFPSAGKVVDGRKSSFLRVNCVALDEISESSSFYVVIMNSQTGETVRETRVQLVSARLVPRLPADVDDAE